MKRPVTFIAAMLLAVATLHAASDWPSIYGPRRDHTSDQKGLLRTWPQDRAEGVMDGADGRRLRRPGRARRQGLPPRQG